MDPLQAIVSQHWGYDTLRPLQHEAMTAAVEGRDSLCVLPTGGGKSLCYQAPALLTGKLTVVVSPLIALMKDQVDQLIARGIDAAFFNSSLDTDDRRRVCAGLLQGQYKLIFVSPERFADDTFCNELLNQADVGAFAIDEAHCISHWGHDFRADYRRLGLLKKRYPRASVHAFTATATPRVREDIVTQLELDDPAVLVGDFFRPNLRYRIVRRRDAFTDVRRCIEERRGLAGIVYCIRRKDVDELTDELKGVGIPAIGYHAGMSDDARTLAQDTFAAGKADVVVATVAFGMGIDRADIRYVIHAAMPKSIEHYQQETGRAGRDGQPADCILFYSGGDFQLWRTIIEKNETTDLADKLRMLEEIYRFCTGARCRHRRLVEYFGQAWDRDGCDACDICTGDSDLVPDSTCLAQKIMSCIARTHERYGAGYIADLLRGTLTDRAVEQEHHALSTFGLIADKPKGILMAWMEQLVDQQLLHREGEYRILQITAKGWDVLRSQAEARLYGSGDRRTRKPRKRRKRGGKRVDRSSRGDSLSGSIVDGPDTSSSLEDQLDRADLVLFEELRLLRRAIADERNIPAFIVFGDKTLRDMARRRPTGEAEMLYVYGIGPVKYKTFGKPFLDAIRAYMQQPNNAKHTP